MPTYLKLKACDRCGGDLAPYKDEFFCMQCGGIVYPHAPDYGPAMYHENGRRRRDMISTLIENRAGADDRWRLANQKVISLIDKGYTLSETARVAGVAIRRVSEVKEVLRSIAVSPSPGAEQK